MIRRLIPFPVVVALALLLGACGQLPTGLTPATPLEPPEVTIDICNTTVCDPPPVVICPDNPDHRPDNEHPEVR